MDDTYSSTPVLLQTTLYLLAVLILIVGAEPAVTHRKGACCYIATLSILMVVIVGVTVPIILVLWLIREENVQSFCGGDLSFLGGYD